MGKLEGRVALISGAARGIGAQTARRMVAEGAKVVIGDVRDELGRAAAEEIGGGTDACRFVTLDVTDPESWQAAVDHAVEAYGRLDVLVNNAGVFIGRSLEEISFEEWKTLVDVNLTGTFLGTRIAAPALREAAKDTPHGSAVINVSSIAGLVGSMVDPLYSMTKGGVTTFTKSTALYFGRRGDRIRVNQIHPGVIETDMGDQTYTARARALGTNDVDAAKQASLNMHPIGRHGTADDIAGGIVFLASDDAGFMTGSSLVVDGGLTAQ
ncbi:SDR family NAD(P)-dependent oxidoreductase [Thalassobaculum salexigens]|uniref:SDR family NAD(P)-dependent oxidoreductase n=1 Tax=Thalassobaculum salexigens TaxID=455360 RepID=UPI0004061201|nr:glucose 1-dehydrogenase [Thalassobaculum salexigens]